MNEWIWKKLRDFPQIGVYDTTSGKRLRYRLVELTLAGLAGQVAGYSTGLYYCPCHGAGLAAQVG